MADVDLRDQAVLDRDIGLDDVLLAADLTLEGTLAFKGDTLREVIKKILLNIPNDLTNAQRSSIRQMIRIPQYDMRLGWSETQVFIEQDFLNDPGSLLGNTYAGVIEPPFPVSITSNFAYIGIWLPPEAPIFFDIFSHTTGSSLRGRTFVSYHDRVTLTVDSVDGYYLPSARALRTAYDVNETDPQTLHIDYR